MESTFEGFEGGVEVRRGHGGNKGKNTLKEVEGIDGGNKGGGSAPLKEGI